RLWSGVAGDLAALAELDEAVLLSGLREQFLWQQVYVSAMEPGAEAGSGGRCSADGLSSCRQTDVGDILIAMSPFQPLPLYRREVSKRYRCHEMGTLPPRIFAVADWAYHAMLGCWGGRPQSQCIVI
ncbi:MYO9A protein, partial [Nyctibius grandis]|nr:MYO9A protein [Nyctibius grandis]